MSGAAAPARDGYSVYAVGYSLGGGVRLGYGGIRSSSLTRVTFSALNSYPKTGLYR